jgi:hypothetical protein
VNTNPHTSLSTHLCLYSKAARSSTTKRTHVMTAAYGSTSDPSSNSMEPPKLNLRKGTPHACENPETLSIAWDAPSPLNPCVPAQHLPRGHDMDMGSESKSSSGPLSYHSISFPDCRRLEQQWQNWPSLHSALIFRKVTSSALTRPSESATCVYMVSCHADPSLMTAQRECRHIKRIFKQIYRHHPMMIHLLASFCSSPSMAWPILCMR